MRSDGRLDLRVSKESTVGGHTRDSRVLDSKEQLAFQIEGELLALGSIREKHDMLFESRPNPKFFTFPITYQGSFQTLEDGKSYATLPAIISPEYASRWVFNFTISVFKGKVVIGQYSSQETLIAGDGFKAILLDPVLQEITD